MYFIHNSNIKCIGLTIKCICFELIYYAISLDAISSFVVYSDFDSIFLSMYC